MNYITADDALLDRLCSLTEPTEIRAANGKVLGTYTPIISAEEKALYARAMQLFDPAETERRKREHKGRTLFSDVIQRLDNMANQ